MLALCTVIGLLCVPREYAPLAHSFAMYAQVDKKGNPQPQTFDAAKSKRLGIELVSFQGDSFQEVSPLGLDRLCSGGWCVYYRKHCEPTVCRYRISGPRKEDGPPEELMFNDQPNVEVHAPTPAALRRITGRLRFVLASHGLDKPVFVPLSRFSQESPALEGMRGCMRSIWVQGCSRPDRPQLRAQEHP